MNAPRSSIPSRTTTDQVVIVGVVEHGDRRGRTIGFPTANLRLDLDHAHIEDGVYAATVRLEDGRCVDSAVSIGRRPTFYPEGVRLCEAHLIDFDDDIYDTCITVTLVGRMRRQERFESVDELVVQLRADVAACTNLLRDR
ncbi:MAG: riboflavin kinase [Actinobacteria bacterium]|nr:MAG: riboflavin kinase [Actinomycetota bacterium]